jgi:glycerol-3-phosphate dehydrogenase
VLRDTYDLAIVGGGINGAGIAADAAGRGLTVLLVEQGDLAGATSWVSSKLIHGGLRYLEHWEFRLVREALAEREVLLAKAPHLIHPLRFVLPHVKGMRPRGLIRLGLSLYDNLADRERLPASASLDLSRDPAGRALLPELLHGFSYFDCQVDDARLVVANAIDAAARGADVLTRTRLVAARMADGRWTLTLDGGGEPRQVAARVMVNAAGPWVGDVARLALGDADKDVPRIRLVKGSHVVVPRIAGAEDAYLMQSPDGRVVFALPYEERFTLIGTTDVPVAGDAADAAISAEEEDYLLSLTRRFFARPPAAADIVWRFAGVRPLVDDGAAKASAVTREYRLDLVAPPGAPALLNVVGGKITTYRSLAEAVLAKLAPHLPQIGRPWTAGTPLSGGDVGEGGLEGYRFRLRRRYGGLPDPLLWRLSRLYGTRAETLLGDARTVADLGADVGGGLSEREVDYLKAHEWARTADDVLWRRTKVGLHLKADRFELAAERISKLL